MINTSTGQAYERLRNMVQDAINALKATTGPRYKSPKAALKTKEIMIVRTGTFSRGSIWAK